jgi:hypothetical protein
VLDGLPVVLCRLQERDAMTELTVHQAMAAVMEDVRSVRKADFNQQQRFSFRGVDSVVNAVGPAMRKHGVVVTPFLESVSYDDVLTSNDKRQTACRVVVSFRFYGPAGDSVEAKVAAEAWDSGDKAAPKAMSVAFRVALLQSFALPTDEPDPDQDTYERANVSQGKSPADDPLLTAKNAVHAAWLTKHQRFDREEMAADFEQWAAMPLDDATSDVLLKYADYVKDGSDGAA